MSLLIFFLNVPITSPGWLKIAVGLSAGVALGASATASITTGAKIIGNLLSAAVGDT